MRVKKRKKLESVHHFQTKTTINNNKIVFNKNCPDPISRARKKKLKILSNNRVSQRRLGRNFSNKIW